MDETWPLQPRRGSRPEPATSPALKNAALPPSHPVTPPSSNDAVGIRPSAASAFLQGSVLSAGRTAVTVGPSVRGTAVCLVCGVRRAGVGKTQHDVAPGATLAECPSVSVLLRGIVNRPSPVIPLIFVNGQGAGRPCPRRGYQHQRRQRHQGCLHGIVLQLRPSLEVIPTAGDPQSPTRGAAPTRIETVPASAGPRGPVPADLRGCVFRTRHRLAA